MTALSHLKSEVESYEKEIRRLKSLLRSSRARLRTLTILGGDIESMAPRHRDEVLFYTDAMAILREAGDLGLGTHEFVLRLKALGHFQVTKAPGVLLHSALKKEPEIFFFDGTRWSLAGGV